MKEYCSDLEIITPCETIQLDENTGYWRQRSQCGLPARRDSALVAEALHVSQVSQV